jgi:murein DD-endopeptidase MepM/ murein hydrolase activator NlpD
MNPTPVQAPNVLPMQNRNPEQVEQLGQTLQQAGGLEFRTGQTIGDRVQEQMDDANTKAAETSFLQSSQSILNDPDKGYFRQQGKNAVDQYQPTQEALVKAGNDAQAGLTNSIQKQMFKQVLQSHLLSFGKQMADYNHGQSVAYAAGESKARADSYQLLSLSAAGSRYQTDENGAPTGDFAKYTKQMEQEVLKTAALSGFDPDSAQAKSMLREQYTALNHAMIAQLLDNHDAYGAKKWFDEQSAAGNIDLRDTAALGNAVKVEYDRQQTIDLADRAISGSLTGGKDPVTLTMPVSGSSINVTAGLGEPRSGGRSHDGIDIAVPVGTQVTAPAAGKVLKVWNDDKFGGGLSVELQLPNGMTAGFAHLSAANVREGDELQQGSQLGLSGKSGNATGPTLHYMMKDADGKYVDPRQVSQPQPNKEGIADPDSLERARQYIMDSDAAPEIKKGAIAQVQTAHSQYRAIQTQQYEDMKQKATDIFFQSGGNYNAIPGSIRTQLRPEDAYKFQKGIPTEDDVATQEAFILHPENQTVDWVQRHKMDLSKGTFISYLTKAQNDANSPDKERNAALDNTQMDDILYKNGFENLVNPKGDDDKAAAVALKSRIMDQFVSEQNSTKTPLTRDRKAQIIRQTVSDQVSVHRSILFDKTAVPVIGLTPDQAQNAYVTVGNQKVKLASIPMQDQMQITGALRRTNQPVTQQNIATYWVEAQKRKGKTVPTF